MEIYFKTFQYLVSIDRTIIVSRCFYTCNFCCDFSVRNTSLLRRSRGFCFLKNRGKEGKAEKRERRKKREGKGKAKKASARFLSKYGAHPGGGCALRCLHAGLWNKEF